MKYFCIMLRTYDLFVVVRFISLHLSVVGTCEDLAAYATCDESGCIGDSCDNLVEAMPSRTCGDLEDFGCDCSGCESCGTGMRNAIHQ